MTNDRGGPAHAGFDQFRNYPLYEAIFKRRARRISKGIREVDAGSLSRRSNSRTAPGPDPARTGGAYFGHRHHRHHHAGLADALGDGGKLLGSPMMEAIGRSAGSPDNAQATVFFMIDDHGTYLLRQTEFKLPPGTEPGPDDLLRAAEQSKVRILDHRLEYPRTYPYYVGAIVSRPICRAARSLCQWST